VGARTESFREFSLTELLGPLNETEKKTAPDRLYVAGDVALLRNGARVSIVGSRQTSRDALERAAGLARMLAECGVVVVSGLAEGIDTAAHETAIRHGGRTVAVLGTPLDESYPRRNVALQRLIMEEHLAVSQFPSSHPVAKKNFPLRNRTMALIADATVIAQASDSSGALHHGWEALRLGRPVFLMEPLLHDPGLKWPETMVRYGAQILSDETLEAFMELLPKRGSGSDAELAF
jgi:DNA processing protein